MKTTDQKPIDFLIILIYLLTLFVFQSMVFLILTLPSKNISKIFTKPTKSYFYLPFFNLCDTKNYLVFPRISALQRSLFRGCRFHWKRLRPFSGCQDTRQLKLIFWRLFEASRDVTTAEFTSTAKRTFSHFLEAVLEANTRYTGRAG